MIKQRRLKKILIKSQKEHKMIDKMHEMLDFKPSYMSIEDFKIEKAKLKKQ